MSHDVLTNDTSSLRGLGQRVEITTNVRKEPLFVRRPGWEFHATCDIVVTFSDVLATWYITSGTIAAPVDSGAGIVHTY